MALAAPKHKNVKVLGAAHAQEQFDFAPSGRGQLARFCSGARRAEAPLARYRIRASKRVLAAEFASSSARLLGTTRAPWRRDLRLWAAFAAMHCPDLLYLTRDPWPWGQPHEGGGNSSHFWAARRRRGP